MRIPKVIPADVLTRVPREPEWHSVDWNDDTASAHEHFFGKSLDEAERLFAESSLVHQEDLMWMPFIPCCYYLQAYSRYLVSEKSQGDSDGASCYITLIAWFGDHVSHFPEALRDLTRRTLLRIASSQGFYEADVDIYGSFAERVRTILAA